MEEEQIRETIKYPCRKCLLREMDKNAYMENLYAYIDRIEGDSKADKAVYEDRLAVCKECKYLNEVLPCLPSVPPPVFCSDIHICLSKNMSNVSYRA